MKTFSVPMYSHPNGDTYVIVEGIQRPCELHTIEQNHGVLKKKYFQDKDSGKAIGTLEIEIDDNGRIDTAYPTKKVFFKDVKKKYLVAEVIEYFEPYVGSGTTTQSRDQKERYEIYDSVADPLTATTTLSYEYIIAHDNIDTLTFNETFVVCEGMRKRYTAYAEVEWFLAPSHKIISCKQLS